MIDEDFNEPNEPNEDQMDSVFGNCEPNQHEQIIIEHLNDFNPVIVRGEDGNNRYTSFGSAKKEVVSYLGWNEQKIVERDINKGISPSYDREESGPLYSGQNPKGDQFEQIMGKATRWEDIQN